MTATDVTRVSMGSTQPLVSVLTPSYNQAAWLKDNLHSVACQTYPHKEHIVMDGGSTDGTVLLLERAESPVRWRSEPDEGQADAINKAFAESRGEIIGWINSDDAYFDCSVVERVVAEFERHPDVDVVYGHSLQTTENGAAIQVLWTPRFDARLLRTLDILSQPAVFLRRSALGDHLLDESLHFAMDYDLWLRLESKGARFRRLDRILAIDRHQQDRKSLTIIDVHRENLALLAQRYDTRFGPEGERDRTAFYLRQRFAGARLISQVRPPFAFSAPPNVREGLWRRQIAQRRSAWPEQYR